MSLNINHRILYCQMELFERAAILCGKSRERIIALSQVDEVSFRLHPYFYRASNLLDDYGTSSQYGKKHELNQSCQNRLLSHLMRVVQDAVRAGDLDLKDSWEPEELAYSFWALFRERALRQAGVNIRQRRGFEFMQSHRTMDLLLDAANWRPFSWEWDYEQTRKRSVQLMLHGHEHETLLQKSRF
jgi:hypothetical protein